MSKFDDLNTYWMSKIESGTVALFRERPEDANIDKAASKEAELTAEDEGHEKGTDAFTEAVAKIQRGIDKKNAQKKNAPNIEHSQDVEKGSRGPKYWDDEYAIATAAAQASKANCPKDADPGGPPWKDTPWSEGSDCANLRDDIADAVRAKQKMLLKDEDVEKISPNLERLLAFGAGWALSGDIVNNNVPAHLVNEWERAIERQASEADRRRIEAKIRRSIRKAEYPAYDALTEYFISKDHAPVPPRVGLMWDAVKHRWTRPERVGRTVWELSGHKRIRGTGTGVHERSVKAGGSGGRGAGSASAGRRFRSIGDSGKLNPHEAKGPAFRRLSAFKRKQQAKKQGGK